MIYFIGNKEYDWVKIGVSIDVNVRLSGIQSSCPVELIVLHTEDGGQSVESKFHSKFRESWIRGEWFRLSGQIQEYIDSGVRMPRYKRFDIPDNIQSNNDLIIELYNKGIIVSDISKVLKISKSTINNLIRKYKEDCRLKQAIREKLDYRMFDKL